MSFLLVRCWATAPLFLLSSGTVMLLAAETAPVASTGEPTVAPTFEPTVESFRQYRCPDWFRDAKFGIWSHWGPSSIAGIGNEYPKDMYKQGSPSYEWHLKHYGHPSEAGYQAVIKSWKAEQFDPDALMAKYKAAGA